MLKIVNKASQLMRAAPPRGGARGGKVRTGADQRSLGERNGRAYRWTAAAACTILVLLAVAMTRVFTSLPACNDNATREIVRRIIADKKIKPGPFGEVKMLAATRSERLCAARMNHPGGVFNLRYRIDWRGWAPQVAIIDLSAQAKIEDAQLQDIKAAADEFLALAKEAHLTGRPPRQSEPRVRLLLDRIFDLAKIEGAPLAAEDIAKATEWFAIGDRVGTVYILAGTGLSKLAELPATAAGQQQTRRNVADFAPEFARYLDFQVKLAGLVADAELAQTSAEDDAPRGLDQARTLLTETVMGELTTLAYDGLNDEWRHQRLALLRPVVRKNNKLLTPEQAQKLRDHTFKVTSYVHDPSVQEVLKALADSFAPQ